MKHPTRTTTTDTTDIILDPEDPCERCGRKNITHDGTCRECGFKCWYGLH